MLLIRISHPLSADWMEIKTNHMAVITPKMNLLQIPIKDKFYFPPSDPAAQSRATEFAQEKGLLNQHKAVPRPR
jgi:glutamine amidotransferase